MIRPDNRLADLPMTPLECRRCHAIVQIRKSSWQQTSIQWDEAAVRTCSGRHSLAGLASLHETDFRTCDDLRESINQAALSGEVPMAER
jgi:hypothetical protein